MRTTGIVLLTLLLLGCGDNFVSLHETPLGTTPNVAEEPGTEESRSEDSAPEETTTKMPREAYLRFVATTQMDNTSEFENFKGDYALFVVLLRIKMPNQEPIEVPVAKYDVQSESPAWSEVKSLDVASGLYAFLGDVNNRPGLEIVVRAVPEDKVAAFETALSIVKSVGSVYPPLSPAISKTTSIFGEVTDALDTKDGPWVRSVDIGLTDNNGIFDIDGAQSAVFFLPTGSAETVAPTAVVDQLNSLKACTPDTTKVCDAGNKEFTAFPYLLIEVKTSLYKRHDTLVLDDPIPAFSCSNTSEDLDRLEEEMARVANVIELQKDHERLIIQRMRVLLELKKSDDAGFVRVGALVHRLQQTRAGSGTYWNTHYKDDATRIENCIRDLWRAKPTLKDRWERWDVLYKEITSKAIEEADTNQRLKTARKLAGVISAVPEANASLRPLLVTRRDLLNEKLLPDYVAVTEQAIEATEAEGTEGELGDNALKALALNIKTRLRARPSCDPCMKELKAADAIVADLIQKRERMKTGEVERMEAESQRESELIAAATALDEVREVSVAFEVEIDPELEQLLREYEGASLDAKIRDPFEAAKILDETRTLIEKQQADIELLLQAAP